MFYFCYKDKETYYKATVCIIIGFIISYITYFFFQTTVPRPILVGNDLFIRILRFVYDTDKPYNCFPSIHALTCYLMIKSISNSPIRNTFNKLIIIVTSLLIIVSTLFIKQHVILDLVVAIFIGEIIFEVMRNYDIKLFKPDLEKTYCSFSEE